MEPKFKAGDVALDKANTSIKVVILRARVLSKFFFGIQTYSVRWYDERSFHTGTALECELTELNESN